MERNNSGDRDCAVFSFLKRSTSLDNRESKLKHLFKLCAAIIFLANIANAQDKVVSPGQGTPERKMILDALRPKLEAELKTELVFVVSDIRASADWAFVMAQPQRKDGKKLDGKKIYGESWEHMDGFTMTAVLRKKSNQWTVLEHHIGSTDVWWQSYCEQKSALVKQVLGVCP
jgi:hypothetical protein